MRAGDFAATGRLKAAFALFGVLSLTIGLVAASAQAGGGTATTAKKCKKKSRSAGVAKKKCKKKGPAPINLPAAPPLPAKPKPPPPPPEPTEEYRADLRWTAPANADLDLEVYYSATESATQGMMGPVNNIPNSTLSSDSQAAGFENFLDQEPPFDREFTYVACYLSADVGPVDYELDWVDAGGNVHNETGTLDQDAGTPAISDNTYYNDGGSYVPALVC